MCEVLFYIRIENGAWDTNVCMCVYSGVCTPRVGSPQTSQNTLVWFTLLLFVVNWRQNNEYSLTLKRKRQLS